MQTNGTARSAQTLQLVYYHQYVAVVSYSIVVGGGNISPTFTYTSFGAHAESRASPASRQTCGSTRASSYSMTNPLAGSGASERWMHRRTNSKGRLRHAEPDADVLPSVPGHVGYSIVGGGEFIASGFTGPPVFRAAEFGNPVSLPLSSPPSSDGSTQVRAIT